MRSLAVLLGAVLVAVLGACSSGNAASQLAQAPTFDPKGQTKCGVTKSQAHPLVVEWPAADRQELEAKAKRGLVPVRYEGCEMEVLDRCDAPQGASYRYVATEAKEEQLHIRNADDLFANLPIGAAKLEGRLENGGELGVDMTMVGRYEADRRTVKKGDLVGDCSAATHLISALTVGAFDLVADAKARIGAGATVAGIGAGADSRSERETLSRDGRKESCDKATSDDAKPPQGCAALIRVEVITLDATQESPPSAPAPLPSVAPSRQASTKGDDLVEQAMNFAEQAEQSVTRSRESLRSIGVELELTESLFARLGSSVTPQARQHMNEALMYRALAQQNVEETMAHAQQARQLATSASAASSLAQRSALLQGVQSEAKQAAANEQGAQSALQSVSFAARAARGADK